LYIKRKLDYSFLTAAATSLYEYNLLGRGWGGNFLGGRYFLLRFRQPIFFDQRTRHPRPLIAGRRDWLVIIRARKDVNVLGGKTEHPMFPGGTVINPNLWFQPAASRCRRRGGVRSAQKFRNWTSSGAPEFSRGKKWGFLFRSARGLRLMEKERKTNFGASWPVV